MKKNKIILLIIIIVLIIFVFSHIFINRKENTFSLISKTIFEKEKNISIKKITMNEKNSPGRIKSVFVSGGKIYILDRYYYKVMVYDKEFKFLYSIGRAGQGPGEIYSPGGIFVDNNKIYIFNVPDRFEIFSKNGEYLKTIKLKFNSNDDITKTNCDSFAICEGKIYLYCFIGKNKVKVFDMSGNLLKNLIKRENSRITPGYSYLADFRRLYISKSKKYLILSSLLDGSSELYDLKSGKMLYKFSLKEKETEERVAKLRKKIKDDKKEHSVISVKVFAFFSVSYDPYNDNIWILKRRRKKKHYVLYIVNPGKKLIRRIYFPWKNNIEIIKFFFLDKNSVFFYDDNYDVYKFFFGG